jgi:ribonuclease-3
MDDLNTKNYLIEKEDVETILRKVNIVKNVKDISLYQKAFTHQSYVKDINYAFFKGLIKLKEGVVDFQDRSNERFEFCGDSIICHVICEYLFLRYPEFEEGMLTKLKTNLVSKDYLSRFASYHNFQKYLLISNHMENIHGRNTDRLLEDAYESFICALNKDLGYLTTKKFIIETLENVVNFGELLYFNQNYKDRLLIFFQKNGWSFPKYDIISQLGPPNKRTFIVNCYYIDERKQKNIVSQGFSNTKKDAEQESSKQALIKFNQLTNYELGLIKKYSK